MGNKEELFEYSIMGWIHLQDFVFLHLESGWQVKEIDLRNDNRRKG